MEGDFCTFADVLEKLFHIDFCDAAFSLFVHVSHALLQLLKDSNFSTLLLLTVQVHIFAV